MNAKDKFRLEIEGMIESDNLSGLLKKAGELSWTSLQLSGIRYNRRSLGDKKVGTKSCSR